MQPVDATRPEPERPARGESASDEGASASGLRCPYCKGELPDGALAGSCVSCGTLHHIACFAEHGGCSTHACGSTHARPGKVGEVRPPVTFAGLRCAACKLALAADAMVARCDGCNTVLHAHCYERVGSCVLGASGACRGSIELMPHEEAARRQARRAAHALLVISALVSLLFAALALLALDKGHGDAVMVFATAAAIGLGLFSLGVLNARATRRAVNSRPRTPRAPGPIKESGSV
jgi:hypothetical protein